MIRPVWFEVRRGSAPVLALATAATGVVNLLLHPDAWVGRWGGPADHLRSDLVLLVPLVAAVACWQGGREHRRGVQELLAGTPRPGWQPLVAAWAALVLAATLGLAVIWAFGVVFVVPHAGLGWAWIAVVAVVPLAVAAALGLAVGWSIPVRLIGLPFAVLLYLLMVLPG